MIVILAFESDFFLLNFHDVSMHSEPGFVLRRGLYFASSVRACVCVCLCMCIHETACVSLHYVFVSVCVCDNAGVCVLLLLSIHVVLLCTVTTLSL